MFNHLVAIGTLITLVGHALQLSSTTLKNPRYMQLIHAGPLHCACIPCLLLDAVIPAHRFCVAWPTL